MKIIITRGMSIPIRDVEITIEAEDMMEKLAFEQMKLNPSGVVFHIKGIMDGAYIWQSRGD